jgi:C-terminal processing protease CtpA/Prc
MGSYQTLVQQGIRAADSPALCGWIIDLRRNTGGDFWTMLAAIGPILGEGQVGGFEYRGTKRDTWAYRDGKVFWNADERSEGVIDGGVFTPGRTMPPVALLTSRVTQAAGELLVIAFKGRPSTRSFGETTSGAPVLVDHTALSDHAELFVSAAYALDRNGVVYKGPIKPDQQVPVDWTLLGTDADPGTAAAAAWLQSQPGCSH